jgi:hypothetical protein
MQNDIQPAWKEHALAQSGVVEEVPLEFVWQYWSYDVTNGDIEYEDGSHSDMDGLWDKLCEEGLRDPLIIRVGLKNKKVRLEAGNHRIQVLRQHGITTVPVTVQVRHLCGPHAPEPMNDATAVFDFPASGIRVVDVTKEYMRPSEVFYALDV